MTRFLLLIPGGSKGKRGPWIDDRRFINALLWMTRSWARLKDLPPTFGAFHTVKQRYYRWLERGLIDRLLRQPGQNTDREWLLFDNTIICAHQHAAGGCTEE